MSQKRNDMHTKREEDVGGEVRQTQREQESKSQIGKETGKERVSQIHCDRTVLCQEIHDEGFKCLSVAVLSLGWLLLVGSVHSFLAHCS